MSQEIASRSRLRRYVQMGVLTLTVFVLASCGREEPAISVQIGPTTIPRGDAVAADDLTVNNGLFAVAFAVGTAPPWGVARGGIVDIGILRGGEPDYDIASLADFMPNNWSGWPTTYQQVSVEKQTATDVVIRTERDWGDVALTTRFYIKAGDSWIGMVTTMVNKGAETLHDLLSGYVMWPDGGNLIADPVKLGDSEGHGWTAAYDSTWVVGLHAPFSERAERLGRDRYTRHSLAPGDSRSFEAWLQIESDGTLAPLIQTEIDFAGLAAGELRGHVRSVDGGVVARPAVVVLQDGTARAWTLGKDGAFQLRLPAGEYEVYATARGYGRSGTRPLTVAENGVVTVDFDDVALPGRIHLQIAARERPLDARISMAEGQKPFIAYYGKDVYFTELDAVGELSQEIAPGEYVFKASAGGGFTSLPARLEVLVESGVTTALKVDIPVLASPRSEGWYSADLHHHSDVLDGFTEAEYVLRSELAAGVDLAFLSDHDSVVNNEEMQRLAASRGVPFLAGTELSPSWGHFNAYPIDAGKTVDIDTGQAKVSEIFREARRLGADVVAVNHPYSDYGYFTSHEKGLVPGGYDGGFDLLEIGPVMEASGQPTRNKDTLRRAWQLWNEGRKAYLVGGSDVHDVWNSMSAKARTYAWVAGELSPDSFVAALLAGNAYASQGPLVYPDILFGSTLALDRQEDVELAYSVQAVTGLRSVTLIAGGLEIAEKSLAGETDRVPVSFRVRPDSDTWYSLLVEDAEGRIAATNPVWVTIDNVAGNE